MRQLARDKKMYIRKCQYCGGMLPLGSTFRVCDRCYAGTSAKKVQRLKEKEFA